MHFLKLAVAAVATLCSTAMAGNAIVRNRCTFPVYLQTAGMGGMQGPVVTLPARTGNYSEPFRGSGSSIKLGRAPALAQRLTVEYSPNGNLVYYSLSNNAGNPFSQFRNTLIPSVASCGRFNCGANNAACYSNGGSIKVRTCSTSANIATTLCAPEPVAE